MVLAKKKPKKKKSNLKSDIKRLKFKKPDQRRRNRMFRGQKGGKRG